MTPETMLEAPAEARAEIRALFAAMDRMDERIAKDFQEMDHLTIKINANITQITEQLAKLRRD